MVFISKFEAQAKSFFSLPPSEKAKVGPPTPFGYDNKSIGSHSDVGWVEYLLLKIKPDSSSHDLISGFCKNPDEIRSVADDYVRLVRKMACEVLEMMADRMG